MAGIAAWSMVEKGVRRPAFTLLELLVCVGLIAVLLGITIPALRGAHERSLDTEDLANLRTSAQDLTAWASEHDDVWPNGGGMTFPYLTTVSVNGEVIAVFDYYEHAGGWIHVLRASTGEYSPAWGLARGFPVAPLYSNCMISDPRLWDACPIEPDQRFQCARVVRTSETAFPSAKGVLIGSATLNTSLGETPYTIAMTDGSAGQFDAANILRGAYWEFCGSRLVGARPPVMHTVHGVLGRDVRQLRRTVILVGTSPKHERGT